MINAAAAAKPAELVEYEWQVLEMLAGDRPGEWGAWVGACLGALQGAGYCTSGPHYQITDAGRKALAMRTARMGIG